MGTGFSVSEYLSKEILGNGYAEEENVDHDEGSRRAPVSRYSGYGSVPGKDSRPSSLRSKSPREREDIRFFFRPEEVPSVPESVPQQKNMAQNSHQDSRKGPNDQHQHEYERLRDQCMHAMKELEALRRKHQEIVNRCDLAVQEADYYRKQHKAVLNKCDQLVREAQALRAQYDNAITGKAKLQQDYEEIVLLREREKMEKESLLYGKNRRKSCEAILDDIRIGKDEKSDLREEALREKLDDIQTDYAIVTSKLNQLDEESVKANEKYELLLQERDAILMERDALQQQCTVTIREYEKAFRDREEAIQTSMKSEQQLKAALKESEMSYRVRLSKETGKLQEERNAALQEYKLVMSERDSVHREIEKLQDDLSNSQKMVASHLEDKEKIQHEAECLRQEINTVLVDRDQAVKESYSLKERLEETLRDRDNILKKFEELRQELEMKKQERDAARKERSEAISHRDKILKECFEVKQLFESPAENIEKHSQLLKSRLDALSKELTKAWTVAEVAKLRRDWAFGERNKIVRESQKLSDWCNVLVSERDRIADELVTLQNKHDVLRTQHTKVLKELISIKKCQDVNLAEGLEICVSTDSAIDTESNECELETLDLEKTSKDGDFGFTIGGGVDAPLHPTDCSIFVTGVSPDGVAYGKLRVNDCILKVNEIDLTNVSSELANQAIQGSNFISLSVLRKRQGRPRTSVQSVKLIRTEDRELGLSIDSGLHIKRIEPGSIASEDETLSIGDKILTINGSQIENIPYRDARIMLKRSIVSLTILKGNASTASSHRSLTIPHVEQDKELSETQSCDAEKSQSSPFVASRQHRCPSVPISMTNRMTEYPASLHSRRSSVMSGSSLGSHGRLSPDRFRRNTISENEKRTLREIRDLDEILRQNSERASFSGKFSEGQLSDIEKEDKMKGQGSHWQPSPPPQPARSNSYMTAIVSQRFTNNSTSNDASINSDSHSGSRSVRPQSAPGSRSFVYSVNNGARRHEILLQNGASPIGFTNWPDSLSHGYSLPKSVGRQNRRTRPNITHVMPSATLPVSNGRMHADSDRRIPDQFSSSGLKIGAVMARSHHRSTSSHASSTSSMSSGFNASHTFIRPVYEEDSREGEPRVVVIQKGIYPLGISIGEGTKGGVFVTMVNENSVAGAAGLQFGDQLLEFNGINLRSATFNQAALILKQSADAATVTVLAQYNPHKLTETEEASANSQEESTQSTPKQKRKSNNASMVSSHTKQNSLVSTATTIPNYEQQCDDAAAHGDNTSEEARPVTLKKPTPTTLLGINLSGGNATGIFVSDLEKDGFAFTQGLLRSGDRILEVNGVSFVNKTAEQAMLELAKPTETVQLIVQYDAAAFRKSKELPGDSFYVRALFDRAAHNKEELNFKRGDILFVTSTLYQGKLGLWKAWLVTDTEDQKKECGTIPSKTKAEQEVLLRRCSVYSDDKMKIRHSFFRRSKKGSHGYSISHSRESSDSRGDEAGSSIGSNSAAFASDSELPAYQLVMRRDSHFLRPIVVIGPLSEPVCDKLVMEWPYKFARSLPEMVRTTKDSVEKDVESGMYLDYTLSRRGTSFACITQAGIKDVIDKNKHCLLDVNPSSLERLTSLNLHAVVMLLKFKSHKQIKELRDGHYIREKLTSREAKDLFDQGTKLERDYKHQITAVIHGNTLHSICSQINDRVQEEQSKALWVDSGGSAYWLVSVRARCYEKYNDDWTSFAALFVTFEDFSGDLVKDPTFGRRKSQLIFLDLLQKEFLKKCGRRSI
eukprot:gene8485-14481_t